MTENRIYWERDPSEKNSLVLDWSPKIKGILRRRGFWSPQATAEMNGHNYTIKASGTFNKHIRILQDDASQPVAEITFNWKDLRRQRLTLASGNEYFFEDRDLLRGVWVWRQAKSGKKLLTFHVDSITHASGWLEHDVSSIPAEERDILLMLGLALQHYQNIWLMTALAVILLAVIKG